MTAAGGIGLAVPTDHLEEEQVRALVARIEREQGRLDILVNDLWGGEHLLVKSVSGKKSLGGAPRRRASHPGTRGSLSRDQRGVGAPLLVRSEAPLHVEVTDGTAASHRRYRENGLGEELAEYGGAAVAVTPGFMRPEQMLAHFGVSEENWRDPVAQEPAFAIAESPHYLARAVAAMAADPDRAVRWNRKSVPSADLARAYGVRDVDGSQPDAWAYFEDTRYGGINGSADEYR